MSLWGKYAAEIPREEEANRSWRVKLVKGVAPSPAKQRAEIKKCREDLLYYVNAYVWQYNPDNIGAETGPFATYPFQDKIFETIRHCILNKRDVVIQKSRKMGLSWISLILMDHFYLFDEWKQFAMMSRSAKAVDSPSPNSLFWKIDFMHNHLPPWLSPKQDRNKFVYNNKKTHCGMSGEASTGQAFVGGRAIALFIDEAAQIEEMWDVWHRTSDMAGCRIVNSTHTSNTNCFAELCRKSSYALENIYCHWKEHPVYCKGLYQFDQEKNRLIILDKTYSFPPSFKHNTDGRLRSPWYDKEFERKGSVRAAAMDLDIDPQGAMSQFVDASVIRRLQELAQEPWWEGTIRLDKDTAEPLGFDPGGRKSLRLWCHLQGDGKPKKGRYTIGCDISSGKGATASCISIFDVRTGTKVGEWSDAWTEPTEFAKVAMALGRAFTSESGLDAGLIWELSGPGGAFRQQIKETGYGHVYYRPKESNNTFGVSSEPGFFMSAESKETVLQEYYYALKEGHYANKSYKSLDEFLNFRYNSRGLVEHSGENETDNPSGAKTNHGDMVIADALSWEMAKKWGRPGSAYSNRPEAKDDSPPLLSMGWRMARMEKMRSQEDDD